MHTFLETLLFATLLISAVTAKVTSHSYTTAEDISSSKTLFISQFQFEKEPPRGTLYAEVGNRNLIVAKSADTDEFQVTWTEEHKLAPAGKYEVKIFTEEQQSNLRKARRDGESTDSITPVATLEIIHQGVSKGPWMSSESVACVAAVLIMYYAYTKKGAILA
ncbi:translocon-associated protein subunit delta-like [Watersipora subatra]|uniref:translocon-associated protein subunit delta-like n=1 Tax=Watersipora subatra TaxID=2589382 RepID=UPI00355C0AB7